MLSDSDFAMLHTWNVWDVPPVVVRQWSGYMARICAVLTNLLCDLEHDMMTGVVEAGTRFLWIHWRCGMSGANICFCWLHRDSAVRGVCGTEPLPQPSGLFCDLNESGTCGVETCTLFVWLLQDCGVDVQLRWLHREFVTSATDASNAFYAWKVLSAIP